MLQGLYAASSAANDALRDALTEMNLPGALDAMHMSADNLLPKVRFLLLIILTH